MRPRHRPDRPSISFTPGATARRRGAWRACRSWPAIWLAHARGHGAPGSSTSNRNGARGPSPSRTRAERRRMRVDPPARDAQALGEFAPRRPAASASARRARQHAARSPRRPRWSSVTPASVDRRERRDPSMQLRQRVAPRHDVDLGPKWTSILEHDAGRIRALVDEPRQRPPQLRVPRALQQDEVHEVVVRRLLVAATIDRSRLVPFSENSSSTAVVPSGVSTA